MNSNRFKHALGRILAPALLAGLLAGWAGLQAQETAARKAKKRASPEFPKVARTMHLSGTVRVEVTIAANGKVKSARVVGGAPIFGPAATDAAKQWEFEPADKESTQLLEFKFADSE